MSTALLTQALVREASYAAMVARFMQVMEQMPAPDEQRTPFDSICLGRRLVHEEVVEEFFPALAAFENSQSIENAAELLDAIADSIYVLLWTAIRCNLPIHEAFLEVQRSNMAKLQPDGTVLKNEFGKVQKPAGWTPPQLFALMVEHRSKLSGEVYTEGGIRNGA